MPIPRIKSAHETQLIEFHKAGSFIEAGKLLNKLHNAKIPKTALARAMSKGGEKVSDYVVGRLIRDYKRSEAQQKTEVVKANDAEVARLTKALAEKNVMVDALHRSIEDRFINADKEGELIFEITLIEALAEANFFRVHLKVSNRKSNRTESFQEYVNFDSDFNSLINVMNSVTK